MIFPNICLRKNRFKVFSFGYNRPPFPMHRQWSRGLPGVLAFLFAICLRSSTGHFIQFQISFKHPTFDSTVPSGVLQPVVVLDNVAPVQNIYDYKVCVALYQDSRKNQQDEQNRHGPQITPGPQISPNPQSTPDQGHQPGRQSNDCTADNRWL